MPQIIMHNQMSLDGAIAGFQIDMGNYYGIANSYGASMYLVGSNTALSGIQMFSKRTPQEKPEDMKKPEPVENDHRPYWVIPDSEGKLRGLLHVYRQYQHCRDVIVLVSVETPAEYIDYLREREYGYIVAGEVKVDLKIAFERLHEKYPFDKMITDNGGTLSAVMFDRMLIDRISLLISPTITDRKNPKLFREMRLGKRVIKLEPEKAEILENRDVLLLFKVVK
ncbi:MAG: dihydrofolate reductase family protein [Bacteroidales bacterium]